jgi:hypothetical protein
MKYIDQVNSFRKDIKHLAARIKAFKTGNPTSDAQAWAGGPQSDIGEVMANLTLAYRHLEDASMRIGKVLQAQDGGMSVYDKETTVGA